MLAIRTRDRLSSIVGMRIRKEEKKKWKNSRKRRLKNRLVYTSKDDGREEKRRRKKIDGRVASLPGESLLPDPVRDRSPRVRFLYLHHGVILDQVLAEVSYHVIVVIHHYAKWLSDNETRPHRDIAPSGAPVLLHLLTYH